MLKDDSSSLTDAREERKDEMDRESDEEPRGEKQRERNEVTAIGVLQVDKFAPVKSRARPSISFNVHTFVRTVDVGEVEKRRWNGCPTGDGRVDGRFDGTSRNMSRWKRTRQR